MNTLVASQLMWPQEGCLLSNLSVHGFPVAAWLSQAPSIQESLLALYTNTYDDKLILTYWNALKQRGSEDISNHGTLARARLVK
eukprot:4971999-Amphidinium_carterae.1